ncbi:MAG: ankyrin repeat domain-containing protein [Rhodobacteraceae bacterium]|nr:ankyrin repeat domain-containing protein [Paracoccaceae bacterium]
MRTNKNPNAADKIVRRVRVCIATAVLTLFITSCASGPPRLHQAIADKNEAYALDLIAKGDSIEQKDPNGRVPLHYAAETGQTKIIEELIQRGADVNAPLPNTMTPVVFACMGGSIQAVNLLRENNARFSGPTCLQAAAAYGHPLLVKQMLAEGVFVDVRNYDRETALHMAAAQGQLEVVELLIEAGASIDAITVAGLSPYSLAVINSRKPVAFLLLRAGSDPDKHCCGGGGLDGFYSAVAYYYAAQYAEENGMTTEAVNRYSVAATRFDSAAEGFDRKISEISGRQVKSLGLEFLIRLASAAANTPLTVPGPSVVSLQEQKEILTNLSERSRFLAKDCREKIDALQK